MEDPTELPGSLKLIRLRESVFNLWRTRNKLLGLKEARTANLWNSCYTEGEVFSFIVMFISCIRDLLVGTVSGRNLKFIVTMFFAEQTPMVVPQK